MAQSTVTDIQSRAQTALTTCPVYLLRGIHVEQVDDSLLLTGRVETYYHKQLAQEVVRAVCDGVQVINSIDVERPPID